MSNYNFHRDFWEEAVAMLPEKYKVPEEWRTATIDGKKVVGMVSDKMKECEDEQWTIKINGKEVVVRELFKKTLGWLNNWAVIGDIAVQYPPGYATLPWAGFRFLLKVKHSRCFLFTSFIARG
jgi:hypothetical protein